jgi:hypothetical protein
VPKKAAAVSAWAGGACDAIALLDPVRAQDVGEAVARGLQLAPRDLADGAAKSSWIIASFSGGCLSHTSSAML